MELNTYYFRTVRVAAARLLAGSVSSSNTRAATPAFSCLFGFNFFGCCCGFNFVGVGSSDCLLPPMSTGSRIKAPFLMRLGGTTFLRFLKRVRTPAASLSLLRVRSLPHKGECAGKKPTVRWCCRRTMYRGGCCDDVSREERRRHMYTYQPHCHTKKLLAHLRQLRQSLV